MNVYGIIGYPLTHSFSKEYFTQKFVKEHLSGCVYNTYPLKDINEFVYILKDNPGLKGLSVTIPYKQSVLPFCHQLNEEVKLIGATNCIRIEKEVLTAYNTDCIGFEQSFLPLLQPNHTKALILGTGGASKAVQYVLQKKKIPFLLVTRNPVDNKMQIGYHQIDQSLLQEYPVIINCTPVGMMPDENNCPDFPYQLLTEKNYLYDLIYKPAETLFLQKGKQHGAMVKNGFDMLLIQAEASWKIWNDL